MSTLNVATVKSLNTLPPAVQNSSGTEIGTFCRAWVNFNGTGTVAIRASFNVSSITDNGTGDYTVNFTNALPDANYASVTTNSWEGETLGIPVVASSPAPTTSACRFKTVSQSVVAQDTTRATVAIFR